MLKLNCAALEIKGVKMEEKFYVNIKDDFGHVRTFEVPTLEMKDAIDNLDKTLKEESKQDAFKYAKSFSAYPSEDYISYKAKMFDDGKLLSYYAKQRKLAKTAIWKVVKRMPNEKYKKILYMRFLHKMKFVQIAEKLGCSKQSISDNYKTAIDDLRVMLCDDKDFQQTYFFQHWAKHLKIETNLIGKDMLKDLAKTKDLSSVTTVDKILDFIDEVKTVQKKEKKLEIVEKTKKSLKDQKFTLFGKTYSVQDMFDTVSEFLDPFRQNKEKTDQN